MGLILDSCVIIAGERRGRTVRQILEQFDLASDETEYGLSVVTIVEMAHGVERAKLDDRRRRRQDFLDELIRAMAVYPITVETAKLAGRIEGRQAQEGMSIAFEDLLIAATALQLGFGVATANTRHFEKIPGLRVVPF